MSPSPELLKLQQSVRESRISISREYSGLLSELDFKKRFVESFRQHPLRWIGGAATAGLVATLFGGSRSKSSRKVTPGQGVSPTVQTPGSSVKTGWLSGALEIGKFLYPILRPLALEFATNAAQSALAKRNRGL
jgi:hypothetical protein